MIWLSPFNEEMFSNSDVKNAMTALSKLILSLAVLVSGFALYFSEDRPWSGFALTSFEPILDLDWKV